MKKVILGIAMLGLIITSCGTKGKTEEVVNDTTVVAVDTVATEVVADTTK